ncbi:MAG: cation diffusion facilitator family transporter [Bdellovibrionaceae bacterium]|nr:cation diffusion facilitator family transporter [Pseudobdellovibrionaceae bacterium]
MSHHHHHGHHHSHSSSHHTGPNDEKKVLVAFCVIFVFMIIEAIGGVLSGSLALLADAGHMFTDAAALALAYAAFRFGRRVADQNRTFGYLRFEVLAGFINALTLFIIVIWIAYEAYHRFTKPPEVLAGPMLGVAVLGLLVNLFVLWYLTRGGSEHVNIKGAVLHVLGDLLGSVGAIVAALVIYLTDWTPIDPILSIVVSLLILKSAWGLLGSSLHILLEGAPPDALPTDIERHLKEHVPHLQSISHVHVWLITSGRPLATLHVRPTEDQHARAVAQAVEQELHAHFNIEHATVAIDWNDAPEVESCSLSQSSLKTHSHKH